MCTTKCLQDSVVGKALMPVLRNQHSQVPLNRGNKHEEMRGPCTVAGVQSHWHDGDAVEQLTSLKCCRGWIQPLQEGQAEDEELSLM